MDFGFFSYPTARPDKENLNPARPGKKPRVRQQSDRIAVGRTLLFCQVIVGKKNLIVTRDEPGWNPTVVSLMLLSGSKRVQIIVLLDSILSFCSGCSRVLVGSNFNPKHYSTGLVGYNPNPSPSTRPGPTELRTRVLLDSTLSGRTRSIPSIYLMI